jgi:hypothetical protein
MPDYKLIVASVCTKVIISSTAFSKDSLVIDYYIDSTFPGPARHPIKKPGNARFFWHPCHPSINIYQLF